jgi:hypothetical protein
MGCAQTVSVDLTLELDENGLLRAEASHRPRWNPGQTVNVEMTIDYWGQRATDAVK